MTRAEKPSPYRTTRGVPIPLNQVASTVHVHRGVLTWTHWVDEGVTVAGRGGFPLSSVLAWMPDNEDDPTVTVYLRDGHRVPFYFPFDVDSGQAWTDFDDMLARALRGDDPPEPERGWWISGSGAEEKTP